MQDNINTRIYGALLGDKHSTDYGLKMTGCTITYPEPDRIQREVPYGPVMDFTEDLLEDVPYKQRTLEMTFDYIGDYLDFEQATMELANDIHGRRIQIVLDFDPWYYYIGVPSVAKEKETRVDADVTITVTADPYKMERFGSLGRWLWDPFPFDGGIIRDYAGIPVKVADRPTVSKLLSGDAKAVSYATHIVIPGCRKRVVPKIITDSDAITLAWWGGQEAVAGTPPTSSIQLPSGSTWLPDLAMGPGEHHLYLLATGYPSTAKPTITIDYRGGML